jgi:hypothetical protein
MAPTKQIEAPRKRRPYVSKLSKGDQQARLLLRTMNRDEKRAMPELKAGDYVLLIGMAAEAENFRCRSQRRERLSPFLAQLISLGPAPVCPPSAILIVAPDQQHFPGG